MYCLHMLWTYPVIGFESYLVPFAYFPQKCKVTETDVHRALLSGDPQDQLVIAYNLVIDNNRIADESK